MSHLGINCTSEQVCIARTSGAGTTFAIVDVQRIAFDGIGWLQLYQSLYTYFSAASKGANRIKTIGIAKRIGGKYSAGPEAFKAEGLVELIAQQLGLTAKFFTPHALKKSLGCGKAETWQAKSKAMFNSDKSFANFNDGLDGAVAAAHGVCDEV